MLEVGKELYIVSKEELSDIIDQTVRSTIENLKGYSIIDPELSSDQVKEELQIGSTKLHELQKGRHRIPFFGSPKKRRIKRSDFEAWKKEHWGKY